MFRRAALFLTVSLFPLLAFAAFPRPTGFVNDFAGLLDRADAARIEGVLSSFERATGVEIALVTLPSLEGRTVEDVAVSLYKEWGIGKRGEDRGALLLIAPNERKARIEVGYGLEGTINDALAGRLLDEHVIPRFKAGDMAGGTAAGVAAIIKAISDKEGLQVGDLLSSGEGLQTAQGRAKEGGPFSVIGTILLIVILGYLLVRHPWLLFFILMSSGRGGGGRGGFGGGFGGFGGGLSGGGGASRGW